MVITIKPKHCNCNAVTSDASMTLLLLCSGCAKIKNWVIYIQNGLFISLGVCQQPHNMPYTHPVISINQTMPCSLLTASDKD